MITTKDWFDITGTKQHSQLQQYIKSVVFNPRERNEFYKKINDIDPQCVKEDIFKDYFEEYAAEHKSNKQDMTPTNVAKLVAQLTKCESESIGYDRKSGWTAYDPTAGTGSLIIQKWNEDRLKVLPWEYKPCDYLYLAEELSDVAIPYLIHNLAFRGMNAVVIHGDTIEKTANDVYLIQNLKNEYSGFSSINVLPHSKEVSDYFGIIKWLEEYEPHTENTFDEFLEMIGGDKNVW